jgi:hypothetical protein
MSQPPLPPERRQKAVVAIGDGLGNVVAQTPLVRAVASLFREVHVWLPRSAPDIPALLEGMPGVTSVNREWIDAFDQPDALFYTWLVLQQARKRYTNRTGVRYQGGNPAGTGRSEVDVCLDPARKAGWCSNYRPDPWVTTDPWPYRLPAGWPVFGFTTGWLRTNGNRWRLKEYPPAHYATVVHLLREKYPEACCIQVGNKHDAPIPHPNVMDTRLEGTLRQSLGLLQRCHVFCGNDTGLCWAASALKIPTVVLFGPTDPSKCLPPWGAKRVSLHLTCQPCQYRDMGKLPNGQACQHECLQNLSPRVVAAEILSTFEARHVQEAVPLHHLA